MKIEYTLPGPRGLPPRAFTTEPAGEPQGDARASRAFWRSPGNSMVGDFGELARLGHVSAARVSQIVLLSQLAPAIQEYILFLSAGEAAFLSERELRKIARVPHWDRQRELFERLL